MNTNYIETNKNTWNCKTRIHVKSDFYDVDGFKKNLNSLNDIEEKELGDVSAKSLLHLQCHFGMDTLSLAKKGAITTGVDISNESIDYARMLSKETGLDSNFVCSDVYDLKDKIKDKFQIIYTSYGVLCWLPDLKKWAELVYDFLENGGFFYIAEFHPFLFLLEDDSTKIGYDYFYNKEPLMEEIDGSYTDSNTNTKNITYTWSHSLSDIINAINNVGFKIEYVHEYDYSPYGFFPNMTEVAKGKWQVESIEGKIPMVFSLKATKL